MSTPDSALLVLIASLFAASGCGALKLETREHSAESEPSAVEAETQELAAAFTLPDSTGELVSLDDLLAEGRPAVLVFYRGHW